VSAGEGSKPRLLELPSARAVEERIAALGGELAGALAGRVPLVVVIAEGARRARLCDRSPNAMCARSRSCGARAAAARAPARRARGCAPAQFAGRDVVVVDDIADEGRTLEAVARACARAPRPCARVVLVSSLAPPGTLALDHVGFEVARGWVVGYGMDLTAPTAARVPRCSEGTSD
jgi:hypoxanthine phosphoribosyltransferase